RNYALLWWGQLVSEVGNRFHWVAVSLWVYSVTGSAGSVSLAVASMFVGSLLVGPWAGVLVDRWDRRKILVVSDLARGVLVALIPPLMGISIWLVYADLVLISVATAFFRPAMFAVVPTVVGRKDLLAANSFFAAMETGTEIFGPALAGVLALAQGYSFLVYLDAGSYFVSALCMMGLRFPLDQSQPATMPGAPLTAEVLKGLRYIRDERLQWQLFLLIFPSVLVGAGLNALQTPLAKGEVGINDAQFGTFQSVWGVGFLVASLLLGWFGHGIPRSLLIVGGFLLGSIVAAGMGLSRSFETLLLSAFAVGFANTLNYVGVATVLMQVTPKHILGRVISLRQTALSAIRVLAPLFFGLLADLIGVRESILLMALVGTAGTAVVAFGMRYMWDMDLRVFGSSWSATWVRLVGSYSPEFDRVDQVRLNVLTVFLLVLGGASVVVRSGPESASVFAGVLSVFGAGILLQRLLAKYGKHFVEHRFAHLRSGSKAARAGMERGGPRVRAKLIGNRTDTLVK
ncbi:MAG: MFS transporter, partial [Armatimonadota bacterium]|nr:MFS transporter [Armatimonadota bacterium]